MILNHYILELLPTFSLNSFINQRSFFIILGFLTLIFAITLQNKIAILLQGITFISMGLHFYFEQVFYSLTNSYFWYDFLLSAVYLSVISIQVISYILIMVQVIVKNKVK